MQDSTSREKMLKKIRQALINKTPPRFPATDWDKTIYSSAEGSLEEQFANAFSAIGGKFIYCETELEFLEQVINISKDYDWKLFYAWEKKITDFMDKAEFPYTKEEKDFPEGMVGITGCEALVARLGSVLVSSRQGSGRRLFPVPTSHIVMAYTSQLVPEMKDALTLIKNKYTDQIPSMIASITGPSRTADIEKTLVSPAHGPRDIFVFLIDDAQAN